MGLFKRKDSNCWQMCFFLEGNKVRMSTKTSNKKVAQRKLDRIKGQIAEGTYNPNRKDEMSFSELVDAFLEKHSRVEKASHKRDWYSGRNLEKFFGDITIAEITPLMLKEWRMWRRQQMTYKGTLVKVATVNRELSMLKTMLNAAVEWGWLDENPAERIKRGFAEKR